MTFKDKLQTVIGSKGPGLCVGLDPDPDRLPPSFSRDLQGIRTFMREVIPTSAPYARAYKVNTAFFEAFGAPGWEVLEEISLLLPENSIRIADAKRGDIGNTAQRYAEAFLKRLPFDAMTVSPYLGGDSLKPFLKDSDKGAYVLALTTNPGSRDLQYFHDGLETLYQRVLRHIPSWAPAGNLGAVVGATHPEELLQVRQQFPSVPLLIPGVGAQGGDLEAIRSMPYGEGYGPVLVNVSRGVLYPDSQLKFPGNVIAACKQYQQALSSKK